jgi:hypothetical protein
LAGFLIGYLAFRGAGYDIVIRQEVAFVIWALIALGFAFDLLPRGHLDRAMLVPALAGAAFLGWMVLSLTWTESAERTVAEIARLLGYLGVMTLAVTSLNRHTFRAAAGGASVAALGIAALAVASRVDPAAFPHAADLSRQFHLDRLSYPLDYWNAVGAWGAMSVAIGLAWSAHARLALTRALALAAVPIAGLAVYLSYSRGGVIATGAAVVTVLALSRNRWTAFVNALAAGIGSAVAILVVRDHTQIAHATGGAGGGAVSAALLLAGVGCAGVALFTAGLGADRLRLPRQTANWAVPSFVAVLLVGAVIAGHGPISKGWDQFLHQDAASTGPDPAARLTTAAGLRRDLWDSGLAAFRAHPLDGTGPGTFEFWWTGHANSPVFVRDAHSLYIEQLAEDGLPGLLLLAALLIGLLAVALRARRRMSGSADLGASVAMCAAFVVFLVSAGVDWMWEETALGCLALGGIAIAVAGGSSRRRASERKGKLVASGVRAAIVITALLAMAVEIPGLVSTDRLRASDAAARTGNLNEARALADAAQDAEPWAASPDLQLAVIDQRAGRLAEARREVRQAASKEPTNWRYPLVQSSIEAEMGHRLPARHIFRRGKRLWPPSLYYSPFLSFARQVYTHRQLAAIEARLLAHQPR